MDWQYKPKSEDQLKKWYKSKVRKNQSGFQDYDDFIEWYNIKDKNCYYCGLSEQDSQQIVHKGLLTSNRFPLGGKTSPGVNRGYWLEIDRKNPKGIYSKENCELTCYYCNNDKSDVFSDEQYNRFKQDRVGFLKSLLQHYNETYEGSDEKKDSKGMNERSKDRTQEYGC